MRFAIIALVGSFLTTLPSTSTAAERSLNLSSMTLLQDGEGQDFRILLRFEGLDSIEGEDVDVANLVIPSLALSALLPLEAWTITSAWSTGSVGWGEEWAAYGASGPSGRCGQVRLFPGDGGHRDRVLCVTRYVREVASEGGTDNGLLLRMPRYASTYSAFDVAALVENLASARLVLLLAD